MVRHKALAAVFAVLALLSFPVSAALTELNNQQLHALLEKNVTIVDVRRADEWRATGVVKNSHLLTFFDRSGGFDAEGWLTKLAVLTRTDTAVILICQTGVRSKIIGNWLAAVGGFEQVYNVTDGLESWKRDGNPVDTFVE